MSEKNPGIEGGHPLTAEDIMKSREMKAGSDNYRAFVGPPKQYDFMGATQLALLSSLGLREENTLLDFGCGSLRAGRFLIHYLLPDRYCGIDPNKWLIDQAFEQEIGQDVIQIKRPRFDYNAEFKMDVFGHPFDFIVAQSVFTHTGSDLFKTGISSARYALAEDGQFLFTVLTEGSTNFGKYPSGYEQKGWKYPGSVVFDNQLIVETCDENGLAVQLLPWFHPRQNWYRAVKNTDLLLDDPENAFRNGQVHFDPRFT
ncbi:MAG: class I SAM-dependent methyltransferase [Rhizobiaceae bacterium]|nr:class I SAM-dependent methyltransferase [Rhizobiaceae bacterium]